MAISTLMKKLSIASAGAVATAAGIAIATTSGANAASFSGTGAGFSIPDNNATGVSSTINVTDNLTINNVTVTLNNLTHTWIGDLVASLTNVNTGTSVDLFFRVGANNATSLGDSSNVGGTYRFNDAFTGNLRTTAAALGDNQIIPSGNYFATTVGGATSLLSAFNGQSSQGSWRLTMSDRAGGDLGSLGSWNLQIQGQQVPEPASVLGLLAVGAMGAGSALKRKQQKANG